jgi:hypothetical protein
VASLREQIVAAIAATLTGTPAGSNVFRSRSIPILRNLSPAIVVTPADEEVTQTLGAKVNRKFDVRVEVIARGTIPDSAADATCVSAHAKLMLDKRLGGLCIGIQERSTNWDIQDADLDAVSVVTTYTVLYQTNVLNIDQ